MTKRAGDDVTCLLKDMRDPEPKAPKRVKAVSDRRRAERAERDVCRAEVIVLAGGRCEYAALFPTVACGWLPDRRQLEVDEIRGGAHRCTEWTDPHQCRLTCPVHHDFKTASKDLALVERIYNETRVA